jgi:CRP-like cAMP-binding protein
MLKRLIEKLQNESSLGESIKNYFVEKDVSSKTILLREGEISRQVFFIKSGCLRQWFNKDGKDITFQFFFEGQAVASIDSFISKEPSIFTIESIEPAKLYIFSKENFEKLNNLYPECKVIFYDYLFQRFRNYAQLFLSRIRDTPKERYEDIINNNPELIKRIPQHYIASYLGISPVSLSRIRNKK